MGDAKVRISLADGVLEFEGSEEFVTTQLERFNDVVRTALVASPVKQKAKAASETGLPPGGKGAAGTGSGGADSGDYDDIFAKNDKDEIQILKDISGASTAEKTVSIAKLLAFGHEVLKPQETVLFEDVRAACKQHGCHPGGNMAKYLKDDKESFIFGGSGKKQTVALSKPGRNAAAALIADLRTPAATE